MTDNRTFTRTIVLKFTLTDTESLKSEYDNDFEGLATTPVSEVIRIEQEAPLDQWLDFTGYQIVSDDIIEETANAALSAKVIQWDWKEQPPVDAIAAAVGELSGGSVVMRELETGGDFYAWVIADHEVAGEEIEGICGGS